MSGNIAPAPICCVLIQPMHELSELGKVNQARPPSIPSRTVLLIKRIRTSAVRSLTVQCPAI